MTAVVKAFCANEDMYIMLPRGREILVKLGIYA